MTAFNSDDEVEMAVAVGVDGTERMRLHQEDGFFTLPGTNVHPAEARSVTRLTGSIAEHDFQQPPGGAVSKASSVAFKATGVGYLHYRVACTRLLPGYITYVQDGTEQYVINKPGMYWFPGPTRHLQPPQSVNGQEHIVLGDTQIAVVPPENIGYCSINSQVVILPGGHTYALESPLFTYHGSLPAIEEVLEMGSIMIFRIRAGEFAVVQDKDGHILKFTNVGRYLLRAPEHLLGIHSLTEQKIKHNTYQRIRLVAGQICFYVDQESRTQFFEKPGVYELRHPAFFDEVIYDVTESVISFGSITRILLRKGQLTFKFDADGHTILLEEPGVHVIERPEVFCGELYDVNSSHVRVGAYTLLNVQPGYVAITYDGRHESHRLPAAGKMPEESTATTDGEDGESTTKALSILGAGRHILDHELWVLKEVRSIQECRLDLRTKVYSRNRVSFEVKAFILYKISDPLRAFVLVKEIEDELKREAEATILSIFGAHDSAEVAQGMDSTVHITNNANHDEPPTYKETSFADIVRTSFQHDFSEFAAKRGVKLTRMRVEHIDFDDQEMKIAVEKQAENTVRIEAERRNVERESQTMVAKAEGEAKALRVAAEGKATAMEAAATADSNRIRMIAAAQAEASNNPLATQIALIKAYAEGQAAIFAALSDKTVVVPSDMMLSTNTLPAEVAGMLGGDSSMFATTTRDSSRSRHRSSVPVPPRAPPLPPSS